MFIILAALLLLSPLVQSDVHRQARCLAGCAGKFAATASIEKTLLSGRIVHEKNETIESYQLCSLGCQKPLFGKGIASLREGIRIYQETGVITNKALPPLVDRLNVVCAESLGESTTVHLAVNLVDEADSPYVCATDIWLKTPMGLERQASRTVYSLNPRFVLTHRFIEGPLYQFRTSCYSFEGQRGQEISSNWIPQKFLTPSSDPLDVSLDHQSHISGYVASHLNWRAPSEFLVSCRQRVVLTSSRREFRDVILDDSNQIAIQNMTFDTTYLVQVAPREMESSGLTVHTKSCPELAGASDSCAPPAVKEVMWLFDSAGRLFLGWTYNATTPMNELSFLVSLKTSGNTRPLEKVVKGTERSVLLETTEEQLEASIVVIDARNRRSARWTSRFMRENQGVPNDDWVLKYVVLAASITLVFTIVGFAIVYTYLRRKAEQNLNDDLEADKTLKQNDATGPNSDLVFPILSSPDNRLSGRALIVPKIGTFI